MLRIYAKLDPERNYLLMKSGGHCEHDICLAVSALINSFHQWAINQEGLKTVNQKLTYGDTELGIFGFTPKYYSALDLFIEGVGLYEHEYGEEVCLIRNS